MSEMHRREFLAFLGRTVTVGVVFGAWGCSVVGRSGVERKFTPVGARSTDELILSPELRYEILLTKDDPIGTGLQFGANADFNCFFPFDPANPSDGMLWTNHEFPEPFLISSSSEKNATKWKPLTQVQREMRSVGGSLVRLRRDGERWSIVSDPRNRRFDANTPIPIVATRPIAGSSVAIGTLGNCAGGRTPWGTLLTCEENYYQYYGDWEHSEESNPSVRLSRPRRTFLEVEDLGWIHRFDRPPEHYGWVVEVHPFTGEAKKLTALGRFGHEGATCVQAADGRTVVYMGDDGLDRCLYKFVSDQPGSLETGTLYAASLERGQWLPLRIDTHPSFRTRFRDQLELLIEARVAAQILGATPLDRPEDIERDPATGDVIVALTNNKPRGRPYGSLLRISEAGSDPLSLSFTSRTWISGGPASGIACPDNMAFDANGDLWVTSDMSAKDMGSGKYAPFGNNGLFFIAMRGPEAGKPVQVASAPVAAELTGPHFLPDGTLLLSVQHPGDVMAKEMPATRSSRWPDGDPRSAVVAIYPLKKS